MTLLPLEQELATFNEKRAELVGSDLHRWVLIHGSQIVGLCDTQQEALRTGLGKFGNTGFLVKQVTAADMAANFVSVG